MKTEEFLDLLAEDTRPDPAPGAVMRVWIWPALGLVLVVVGLGFGLRFPLEKTLFTPEIAPKLYLPLLLGLVALPMVARAARPVAALRTGWLWIVPVVAVIVLLYAYVTTPAAQRMPDFLGQTLVPCLLTIPALSAPLLAVFLATLRRGAVLAPARAGLIAGLAAGGLGTAVYALHCTEDSPLFYVTWYGLGIAITAALGAVIGRRVLRW